MKNILKNTSGLAAIAVILCAANPAHATKAVTSPYVTKGKATVEWRGGYETDEDDDDVAKMRFLASYGFTDFWDMRVSANTSRPEHEDMDFTNLTLENKFQLTPKGEYFFDTGMRIDYGYSVNSGTDELSAKLLLAKKVGAVSNIANFEVGREVGEDSSNDLGYGFSYSAAYPLTEKFSLGGEWYSDFGTFEDDSDSWDEQEHMVGPVAYGSFGDFKYQAGVLAGVSDAAPDATFKLNIAYSFQF